MNIKKLEQATGDREQGSTAGFQTEWRGRWCVCSEGGARRIHMRAQGRSQDWPPRDSTALRWELSMPENKGG